MAVKKYWKLAVYKTDRLLGGHEEGGWYYTAGERIKEGKIFRGSTIINIARYTIFYRTPLFPSHDQRG